MTGEVKFIPKGTVLISFGIIRTHIIFPSPEPEIGQTFHDQVIEYPASKNTICFHIKSKQE